VDFLQTTAQALNTAFCVIPANRQLCFQAPSNRSIGPQGMGFRMGNEPVYVQFGAWQIADPKEYPDSPRQSAGQRYRMVYDLLEGFVHALHGLSRIALQPQDPCQGDAGPIVPIGGKIDRAGPLRARPIL